MSRAEEMIRQADGLLERRFSIQELFPLAA